jgi:parallel beta-helix repeat protein
VTVERSLTLEGRSGAVIQAPAGEIQAIVLFRGPQTSRLEGFTISGAGSDTVGAGVRATGFGGDDVPFDPTHLTVTDNHISDISDTRFGRDDGMGIFIYQSQGEVSDNTVERYGFAGIVADGADVPNTSAQIEDNTIKGRGPGSGYERQVGIRLDETVAEVQDNKITDNYGTGAEGVGTGILVIFANVSISDNTVKRNDTGVHFGPGAGELSDNVIRDNAGNGIELFSTVNATIEDNTARDNGGSGIYLAANTSGNTIKDNTAKDNGGADIFDGSGPPPANSYEDNECDTSSPGGLCED